MVFDTENDREVSDETTRKILVKDLRYSRSDNIHHYGVTKKRDRYLINIGYTFIILGIGMLLICLK